MAIIQNLEAFVQSYPAGLDSVTDLQLSQNENGRQIRFTIGGVTIPAGSVATISGTKPDGVVYSNTGTIEGSDTVIFDEDVQMTAVFGTWYAKIRITNAGNTIASARVRFIIDKDPVDAGAIPSESQLNGLVAEAEEYAGAAEDAAERAAITYGSPLTAATASAMTDINRVYVYTGSESGYTYGNWYYYNGSAWVSGGVYNSAAVETDTTLTESGVPADAKATGDKIAELKDDISQIEPGLSAEAKQALLACFANVAWANQNGQTYYDDLQTALYGQEEDWTWKYEASSGVLFSEYEHVSSYEADTGVVEEIVNGKLKITQPLISTGRLSRYRLSPQTNTKAKLASKIKFTSIPRANSNSGTGFRLQLSNNTSNGSGVQIFERKDVNDGLLYWVIFTGGTAATIQRSSENTQLETNKWYVVEIERTETKQIVYVNKEKIAESSVLSTNYCNANQILLQSGGPNSNPPDVEPFVVEIEWIAYKNNDQVNA